jgi:hypothetical protein
MTVQLLQNDPNNRDKSDKRERLEAIFKIWLGRRDSNPRMPGPKPGALPLGHALMNRLILP